MKKLLIGLILMVSSCSSARFFEPLDKEDKYMLAGSTALICVDWAQTKTFISHGKEEDNPALGKSPSQGKIDLYIGSSIVINYIVAVILPPDLRKTYLNFIINSEYSAIKVNARKSKDDNRSTIDISRWNI